MIAYIQTILTVGSAAPAIFRTVVFVAAVTAIFTHATQQTILKAAELHNQSDVLIRCTEGAILRLGHSVGMTHNVVLC